MSKNNPVRNTSVTVFEQGFINVYVSRATSMRSHFVTHASHKRYLRAQARVGDGFDLSKWGTPGGFGGPHINK